MRVALTGGIASGKSTVARLLAGLGALVIDADQLARDVVEPGTPGLDRVVERFGREVLTDDGHLDRPAVAAIVFKDVQARKDLEAIVHPLVHEAGQRAEADAEPGRLVVHDIPLLAEAGRAEGFDAVIVVDTPAETQVARMVEDRGWTREDAEARIAAQAPREQRRSLATHVIDNSGSREDLEARVREVYAELTG
jgi:dephospho-CoA kinase